VRTRPRPSVFVYENFEHNNFCTDTGGFAMPKNANAAAQSPPTNKERPPIVRVYDIGGTKYIVTATVKDGVSEDAAAKVRRLIRKEIARQKDEN
jgi:hypothetical protein